MDSINCYITGGITMSIKNGMANDYAPKSKQELQREENLRFDEIRSEFTKEHYPLAYSLLFFYLLDKLEQQSFIDYELNDKWDRLQWAIEDMADDEDTPEGVKYVAKRISKATYAEYYPMLALLRSRMSFAKLDSSLLMDKLNEIVEELLCMQQATQAWLERNTALEWNEHRPESELQPIVLLSSLLEINCEGFIGLLNNQWALNPEHHKTLQLIDAAKMLNFDSIDRDLYPY